MRSFSSTFVKLMTFLSVSDHFYIGYYRLSTHFKRVEGIVYKTNKNLFKITGKELKRRNTTNKKDKSAEKTNYRRYYANV